MTLNTDRNSSGLTCIAAYSGRLFYSGASSQVIDGDNRSPNLGTFVFFTQVIRSRGNYDKCYQDADPTSENISDLLPTDGGFVVVSEADRIFKLVPLGNVLLVFADNGVWAIWGGDAGFSATNFQVTKVSNSAADAPESIVVAEDILVYWGKGGIYAIQPNQITLVPKSNNITEETIQTLYTDIPVTGRRNAVGSFDPITREIRWLYNDSTSYDGVNNRWIYNKELIFNTVLQAFHVNTLSNNTTTYSSGSIAGYYVKDSEFDGTADEDVTVGGETVTASGEDVTVVVTVKGYQESATKYLTIVPESAILVSFGLAQYNNSAFKDWSVDDAVGKLTTGYDSFGDTQRIKQLTNVTMHMKRTEDGFTVNDDGTYDLDNASALSVQFQWSWADTENGGSLMSDVYEGYRLPQQYIPENETDPFNYPYTVISTMLQPQGSGSVLSIDMTTQEGKDAYVLGWGVTGSGTGRPSSN